MHLAGGSRSLRLWCGAGHHVAGQAVLLPVCSTVQCCAAHLFFVQPPASPAHVQRCPVMSAGPQYEYLWADGVKVKTPLKLSAPDYINCLFDWVEEQVSLVERSSCM